MKACVTEFRLDVDHGYERSFCGQPRRFVRPPTYTVTLEMVCDAEAAEAFQRWIQQQYGYQSGDVVPWSEPEQEQTMLLEDGRELLLTDGKAREKRSKR